MRAKHICLCKKKTETVYKIKTIRNLDEIEWIEKKLKSEKRMKKKSIYEEKNTTIAVYLMNMHVCHSIDDNFSDVILILVIDSS